ncbi:AAA family ATPase [Salinactinospora qingdaonensis]|uniref:AAA family ATPase n=1 Tax=Salinactinospora qingdaonensis TaxID=702744 RepID=A0ABP7GDN1_9ACTN
MKLAISGTYSSGKTLTVMALSHYTGIPRTLAKTIREILPEAVPGKSLAQCTWAEFLQLMVRRHVERAVHEKLQPGSFISDGSSLQEWTFGKARTFYGTMNPAEVAELTPAAHHRTEDVQMRYFDEALDQFGHAFKQHVAATFDAFVHLRHELPLADDGHRPMNESFRSTCDQMLQTIPEEIGIPHYVVSGNLHERLNTIVDLFELPTVRDIDGAIALAEKEHAKLDMRFETERVRA